MVRIHKSKELLELWLRYYSRYFDTLIVFSCKYDGKDGEDFIELKEKYDFELIKIPDDIYTMDAHRKVFEKQKELLTTHEWVLYSDADELVVADPEKYDGLRHFMDVCPHDQTFCVGYEVIQMPDETRIDYDKPFLEQRKCWVKDKTKSYNKPLLARTATDWGEGFHYIQGWTNEEIDKIKNTGLFLLHLKHIDIETEFDYSKDGTGTKESIESLRERARKMPDKIRKII